MTALKFGIDPLSITVNLSRGYDFVQVLRRKDGEDWPDGTEVSIRFTFENSADVVWDATVDGPYLRWHELAAASDAVLDADATAVKLDYTGDASHLLWALGDDQAVILHG